MSSGVMTAILLVLLMPVLLASGGFLSRWVFSEAPVSPQQHGRVAGVARGDPQNLASALLCPSVEISVDEIADMEGGIYEAFGSDIRPRGSRGG
jgi:hypothetical protein